MNYIVKVDDREYELTIERRGNIFVVRVNKKEIHAEIAAPLRGSQMSLIIKDKLYNVVFDAENHIMVNEEEFATEVVDKHIHKLMKASPTASEKKEIMVTVPMPGLVIEVEVNEGDTVSAGQGLIIVEAMKMQNEIKAPMDGIVKQILVKKGQSVNSREKLMIIH